MGNTKIAATLARNVLQQLVDIATARVMWGIHAAISAALGIAAFGILRRQPAADEYLNLLAPIDRGAYDQLPALALVILAVGALTRRERGSPTQGLYS